MRGACSYSWWLDRSNEVLQRVGSVADFIRELADDSQGLGRPADLHQFVDEILARLQRAQELHEFLARSAKVVGGPLCLFDQLAPFAHQELLLLLAVARLA